MNPQRERLIELVSKIMAADYVSEAELDSDVVEFCASVPHPNPSDLIFYWHEEFSSEPTATEVVDRALGYEPKQL